MAKISDNSMRNVLTEDWSKDSRNGLPYSGKSVREALQALLSTLSNDKLGAVYFDTAEMKLLTFAKAEDRDEYVSTGDKALILDSQDVVFAGTQRRITISKSDGKSLVYFTSNSDTAEMTFSFESQEKEITATEWSDFAEDAYFTVAIDRGSTGAYSNIVENVFVKHGESYTVDVMKYLIMGANRVRVSVTGAVSGQTGNFIVTANLTTMYLSPSNFAWYTPFIEGNTYNLGGMNIGGVLQKTLYVKISNEGGYSRLYKKDIGINIYTNNAYYFTELEFPSPGTGIYNVDCWLDAEGLESDHLVYNIMCVSTADIGSAKLCCVSNVAGKAINYSDNKFFDYAVYNGGSTTASPTIAIRSIINTNPTLIKSETLANVPTAEAVSYKYNLEIDSEETDMTLDVVLTYGTEQEVVYVVDNSNSYPAVRGADFYMNAANRSNTQENRYSVINEVTSGSVVANWENMSWVDGTDGWTVDENGRKCLVLPAMTRCTINYQPLATIGTGKTIEITYKVRNASDMNAVVASICSDPTDSAFRGILIRPNDVIVHSRDKNYSDSDQSYQPADEEVINLQVTVIRNYKTNYGNLCKIYCNGVIKREFEFDNSDDFATNASIILGCDTADLYIYAIRTYSTAFDKVDAMRNFIASLSDSRTKAFMNQLIDSVVDDSYNIDYHKVVNVANVATVEVLNGAEMPHYGLSKSYSAYCNLEVNWHDNPQNNFKVANLQFSGQGTTSMNYWEWNLRFRSDKGKPTTTYANGTTDTSGKMVFDGGAHPAVQRLTAKINYASSMQSHKMGATGAFNDLHHELDLDNEVGGRVAIYQQPFYFFQKIQIEGSDQYTYRFMGLFTFGPDKGDKATFGYDNATYKPTLIHMEGMDHQIKSVGMDYPWSGLKYVADKEAICVDKGNGNYDAAWEVGASGSAKTEADIQALLDTEFKPAYNVAYDNSTMILGVTQTLAEINADVNAFGLLKDEDGHAYQRYEVFTDGVYDLYYLNSKSGKYEANGVNLLTDTGISASELSGKTLAEKTGMFRAKRRERFIANMQDYWHLDDCLFHYAFLELIGATDNLKKNSYPYKFGTLESGSRWRWRQDDLDTIGDIDNQGKPNKSYSIEGKDFTDASKTAYVFKGEDSVFWTLIYECYQIELRNMGKRIFAGMEELSRHGSTTVDKLLGFFQTYMWDKAQEYFTKSAYNADAEFKYEEAWPKYNDGSYSVDVSPLEQSLGDHLEAERNWFYRRIIYMMSKWGYGPFASYTDTSLGRITFRTQLAQGFDLTPYMDLYPTILSGQGAVHSGGRTDAGEDTRINGAGGTNTNVYIMGADLLEDVGDLSTLAVDASGNPVLGVASKRLKTLKVGDETAENVTSNVATLNVGQCDSLVRIDARNLKSLTGTVDLSKCPRLREALFGGTDVRSLEFANGSKITHIQLSDAITALTLRNLTKLETLDYNDISKVEFFRVENCSSLNPFEMLKDIYNAEGNNLQGIRVVGFNFSGTVEDVQFLAALANDVDKDGNSHDYKGIDSDGNVQDITPVIEGKISINGNLYEDDFNAVVTKFPQAVISFNGDFYIVLEDAALQEYFLKSYGDGVGWTKSTALTVTSLALLFRDNTIDAKTFNDLGRYFRNTTDFQYAFFKAPITSLSFEGILKKLNTTYNFSNTFERCENLEEVDFTPFKGCSMNLSYCFYSSSIKRIVGLQDIVPTDMSSALRLGAFEELDFSKMDMSKLSVGGLNGSCRQNVNLKRFVANSGKKQTVKANLSSMFYGCTKLEVVDMSDWDLESFLYYTFFNCDNLTAVYFNTWSVPQSTNNSGTQAFFQNANKLTTFRGVMSGIQYSLSASWCPLDRESALVLINGLNDLAGGTSQTLTLSSTTKALLTEADIKIATDKGWTIA